MREQKEKIRNGQKRDKRLEGEGGARLSSGGIHTGGVRGASLSVISRKSRDAAGGKLQE